MNRTRRTHHASPFLSDGDFNEQMYTALKQSPWWMISIALHVFVFLVASLFTTTEPKKEIPKQIEIGKVTEPDDPEDIVAPPDDVDPIVDTKKLVENPDPLPEVEDQEANLDSDLPNESIGDPDAKSTATLDGPNENPHIGIGGNAGNPYGRGGPGGSGDGGNGPGGGPGKQNVLDALRWLQAHQSPSGQWEAAGFDRWCDGKLNPGARPDGKGKAMYDVGVSGLALCSFLGAGYTHRGQHPFRKTMSKGLRYLKSVQNPEGCFGSKAGHNYIYNHATASLAMVEAYGMTGSAIYRGSAQRAIEYIGLARNPYFAWRYGVKPGDNDTSVTGWMMMAVKSAKLINEFDRKRGKPASLVVDAGAFDGIRSWLDKVTDPDYGRVGYITRGSGSARPKELVDRFPTEKSEAMTAAGLLARLFMGEDPRKSAVMKQQAKLLRDLPPTWNPADGSIDMYYWYYGALAMYQMGGADWRVWKKALDKAVIRTQRKDGDYCQYKGSWDPLGPWGADGGRVYSTAVMAMCLQVVERYDRVPGSRN